MCPLLSQKLTHGHTRVDCRGGGLGPVPTAPAAVRCDAIFLLMRLAAPTAAAPQEVTREQEQRIILHGVTWSEYETLLAVRGDRAGIRIAYLEGELEITTPRSTTSGSRRRFAGWSRPTLRSSGSTSMGTARGL